jgi:hypothetical protein
LELALGFVTTAVKQKGMLDGRKSVFKILRLKPQFGFVLLKAV